MRIESVRTASALIWGISWNWIRERSENLQILILATLTVLLGVRAFLLATRRGGDFAVFYRAALAFWERTDPYVIQSSLQGFVFKYPPWILPLLSPLGLVELPVARVLFALLSLFLVADLVRMLVRQGVRAQIALITLMGFYFIFLEHFMAGQITLAITWGLLRAGAFGVVLASSKIFPLVAIGGIPRAQLQRHILRAAVAAVALSSVSVVVCGPEVFAGWLATSNSGARELGESIIRGPGNHAWVNFWGRVLQVSPLQHPLFDPALGLFIALLGALYLRKRRVTEMAAWIALGLLATPLGWVHSYVMAYPLCALNLERAWRGRSTAARALAMLSLLLIGAFVPQVATSEVVAYTDLAAFKAWGVVLALGLVRPRAIF